MNLTGEEKDRLNVEAQKAYFRCYGEPTSDDERFYVMKGIEAMAAVVYDYIEYGREDL